MISSSVKRRLALFASAVFLTLLVTALSRYSSLSGEASLIWPVTGLVVGLSLAAGPFWALPVALGAGVWAVMAGLPPALWALLLLEVLVTAWVVGAWPDRLPLIGVSAFRRLMTIYFRGAVLGAGAAAVIGGGALAWSGLYPDYDSWEIVGVYWVAAAIGVVLLTPLLLDTLAQRGQLINEDALFIRKWTLAAVPVLLLAFGASPDYGWMVSYLLVPLLIWAALRTSPMVVHGLIVLAAVLLVYIGRKAVPEDVVGHAELVQVVVQILALSISIQVLAAVSRERQQMLLAAKERAVRDPLTGLLNENGLRDRLKRNGNETAALVVLRIEDFDNIGDILGHAASDAFERAISAEFSGGNGDAAFGRLGRGLYAGLLPETVGALRERMMAFYRRIDGRGLTHEGRTVMLRPTISLVPVGQGDSEGVLATAVDSVSVAQWFSGERFVVVDDPVTISAQRRRQHMLVEDIKAALLRRELVLYLQPIVPLSEKAGHTQHGEVLLRWKRADGSLVLPGEFLGVAESAGLMGSIDRYVIESLFEFVARHQKAAERIGKFAINLSGNSVSDPSLTDWIADRIRAYDIDPKVLCFELTESQAIANREAACRLIRALRSVGASVSLDDFGTGLATFDYLKSFPFDYVKIDGSFVRKLEQSPVDQAIVASITRVAETLSLSTIAEFVENPQTIDWLRAQGVDYAQGYAVGRPEPIELIFGDELEPRRLIRSNTPSSLSDVGAAIGYQPR